MRHTLTALGFAAILLGMLSGCTTSGVGDPCEPERVPEDGFDSDTVFIETNSVQCRTRVCMVYKMRGNPRHVLGEDSCPCAGGMLPVVSEDGGTFTCPNAETLQFDDCVSRTEVEQRVLCSCRCALSPGSTSSIPLCNCPGGFACEQAREIGGPGLVGGYCVPEAIATP